MENNANHLNSLREKASKLPLSPGVYLMKDSKARILYIGKAKQLKNRVSSYFVDTPDHTLKTTKLVERIREFDYIVTLTELDSLVLEASLIKQHRPKYNINLKDAKGFNYVKISSGDYPRLTYTHNNSDKTCGYIGPYAHGFTIKQSVIDANRIFRLPSCNRKFPDDFAKNRPCLNHRIDRCIGVCLGEITADEYKQRVKSAIDYIKKGSKESVRRLTTEMDLAAENLDFEKAARLRDEIAAIKRTDSVQNVQSKKTTNYHIAAIACNSGVSAITVVKYSGGRLIDKESFYIGDEYNRAQMLKDFLLEYYSNQRTSGGKLPSEIYLETEIEDKDLLEEYLKTKFTVPKRGEGLAQITLARSNAEEYLALKIGRKSKESASLEELAKLLGLPKPPKYIECYDISNIGENVKVGGLVVYRNGKPLKSAYRKFTIKDVDGLDDYACMREVIRRRYAHPHTTDLILLDGGVGHVSTVKSVLDEMKLEIPLFGLVKDSKHKTRAVSSLGKELELQSYKSVFSFLSQLQEEVHRFSITFAREKHKKSSFALLLTNVSGIGTAKATALLKQFKTKGEMKSATIDELREVAKINQAKAEELKKFIETM